ncbi:hypothetical protein [Evansella clarkii]|uniref:hypothetical protein n=1 Tax=Evansella clarkii TaxID=79879 RepID=UPI0009964BC1|nr:hypothetical protein [Evansella clarkii]
MTKTSTEIVNKAGTKKVVQMWEVGDTLVNINRKDVADAQAEAIQEQTGVLPNVQPKWVVMYNQPVGIYHAKERIALGVHTSRETAMRFI